MRDDHIKILAAVLRDQVKLTWSPPLKGRGMDADVAQTAVMQTIAFVFGRDFLGGLTENQNAAITQGLEMLNEVLGDLPYEGVAEDGE